MKLFELVKAFAIAFLIGIFSDPDPTIDMKPERIQFWEGQISPSWTTEKGGTALTRTIYRSDARSATSLAKELAGELGQYGYEPASVDVDGGSLTVRLTTASAGRLTERDYAAALLIDLIM